MIDLAKAADWTVICTKCGAQQTASYRAVAQTWMDDKRSDVETDLWLHDGYECPAQDRM